MTATTTPAHYPLLPVADCPDCHRPVRLRVNGVTRQHRDPRGRTCIGRRAEQAPTTFARWLYLHRARKDLWTNDITQLAVREFGGPRHCGDHGLDDAWTTADELHAVAHTQPGRADGCDWVCDQIALAGAVYAGLLANPPEESRRV